MQGLLQTAQSVPPDPRICLELRLDAIPDLDTSALNHCMPDIHLPVIATCRSSEQGGNSSLSPRAASDMLSKLSVAYRDEEFEPRLEQIEAHHPTQAKKTNSAKLFSHHDFHSIPNDLEALIDRMEQQRADSAVVKVAWRCSDICDNIKALSLLRSNPGKRILICMGEKGVMSRVLASKAKAFGTFCAADPDQLAAPGQLSVDTMLDQYRWKSIDEDTQLFGVIGSPVEHSVSPVVFNTQFGDDGFNGAYLPLLIDSSNELERFLEGCLENAWLDATGFSVTIPHKEHVYRWLGDRTDERAKRIGAVNTLHLKDGCFHGYNTDYEGVLGALAECGLVPSRFASLRVSVLGAGGVARSVVAALIEHGSRVTIFNRTPERAAALAHEFDCTCQPWEARASVGADLIVNCTSIGMRPDLDSSPFPAAGLGCETVVFDTVYRPFETRLILEAKAAGCTVIKGLEMFIHQAAAQYRIWTGLEPDLANMRSVALSQIAKGDFESA